MPLPITVLRFTECHAAEVRDLFIKVNRLVAPPQLAAEFEIYIARSLKEEIDRISDYYSEKKGGFWVAIFDDKVAGMFGLETSSKGVMELRRMYVDPKIRRQGFAKTMLAYAEAQCRSRGCLQMILSTSELQPGALSLYKNSGYLLVREETATTANNKTIGGGIRRYHFTKEF